MRSTARAARSWKRGLSAAAWLALLAASAGCKGETTPIHELLQNAAGLDGQTVQVVGEVITAAGAFGKGVYQIDDGTGSIMVVTEKGGVPAQGSKVGVRGTFRSAFTVGTDVIAVIQESDRRTR